MEQQDPWGFLADVAVQNKYHLYRTLLRRPGLLWADIPWESRLSYEAAQEAILALLGEGMVYGLHGPERFHIEHGIPRTWVQDVTRYYAREWDGRLGLDDGPELPSDVGAPTPELVAAK